MLNVKRILAIISAICIFLCATGCDKDNKDTTASTTETSTSVTEGTTTTTTTTTTKKTKPSSTAVSTTKAKKTTTTATKADGYLYAYAGFDPVVTDMSVPFAEILLNRYYRLPDGYTPKLAEAVKGSGAMLDYRVAPYYQQMYDAALDDGITLTPISGYRSYARQKRNFENRIALYESQGMSKVDATVKASEIILLPGTSEHNAGLAMDICSLEVRFENSKEFRWLQDHAHEYGFIMRYPKDKTYVTKITYEPWHYRYVGVEIAGQLKSSGMVLEEYLQKS